MNISKLMTAVLISGKFKINETRLYDVPKILPYGGDYVVYKCEIKEESKFSHIGTVNMIVLKQGNNYRKLLHVAGDRIYAKNPYISDIAYALGV